MDVRIIEREVDIGETYRYRGETRYRPKIIKTFYVYCPKCRTGQGFRRLSLAREVRDKHVCEVPDA